MAEMEGELFLIGHWKNYQELEDNLSMPELQLTLESYRNQRWEDKKFAASLQSIDLEGAEGSQKERFAAVEDRARARLSGKTAEQIDLAQGGIAVEEE